MLTLQTATTTISTRINQILLVTFVRIYTLANKLARSALYTVKKDVSLQGTPRKSMKSPRRDLTAKSTNLS